jgi:hypothetical protein
MVPDLVDTFPHVGGTKDGRRMTQIGLGRSSSVLRPTYVGLRRLRITWHRWRLPKEDRI